MGLLRLILALSVIAGHSGSTVFGFTGIGANYAVFFFFIISGFYMAMVLSGKYRDTPVTSFYKSRALRLFPTYYIGAAISLAVSYEAIASFFGTLTLSSQIFFLFQNIAIFGQDISYAICSKTIAGGCADALNMTVNPPSWSLAVELSFYLVAPFVVKNAKSTLAFVLFGCAYLLSLNAIRFPIDEALIFSSVSTGPFNYYFYPTSCLFFGAGALAYHLSKSVSLPNYYIGVAALFVTSMTQTLMPFWHVFFIALAIPTLFKYTASNKIDRIIGELSYPAYILHFPIMKALAPYLESNQKLFSIVSFGSWISIIACAIGLLIYLIIEKKIDAYRKSEEFLDGGSKSNKLNKALKFGILAVYFGMPIAVVSGIYANQQYTNKNPAQTTINLTDVNWTNGIGNTFSGILLANSDANIESFTPGRSLLFSTGEIRKITSTNKNGIYFHVLFEGPPINGSLIGYPKKLSVSK